MSRKDHISHVLKERECKITAETEVLTQIGLLLIREAIKQVKKLLSGQEFLNAKKAVQESQGVTSDTLKSRPKVIRNKQKHY